jgi:hypothetical protein
MLASALAAALLVLPSVGCRSPDASPQPQHLAAITLAGYHIQVTSDRPVTIESRGDHALIAWNAHRLRVEKGRVVLDDNETAAFPITAVQISIEVTRRTLRMTADGAEMWKKSFTSE